jgi:hypothetical protein
MEKKTRERKLTLTRETLRRLEEPELKGVAGGAPTHGATCDCNSSPKSLCASCLCPI